jgi:hypothetical protein
MIEVACSKQAHVDLDYLAYFRHLHLAWEQRKGTPQGAILARIIGMFQPYEEITIPVLNIAAIKQTDGNLSVRIEELRSVTEALAKTPSYRNYAETVYRLGESEASSEIANHRQRMEQSLDELIEITRDFSRSIAAILKITQVVAYIICGQHRRTDRFNPLLINLAPYHQQAALSALDRIIVRG